MRSAICLVLSLLASAAAAAVVPLAWLVWDNPDPCFQSLQREWQADSPLFRVFMAMFVVPAVANTIVGFVTGLRKTWALLPLCLALPVIALILVYIGGVQDDPGAMVLVAITLMPACVAWLAGRLGQVARTRASVPDSCLKDDVVPNHLS